MKENSAYRRTVALFNLQRQGYKLVSTRCNIAKSKPFKNDNIGTKNGSMRWIFIIAILINAYVVKTNQI